MQHKFKGLLEKRSSNNTTETALLLLRELKVPVTASSVIDAIETHPDFPSLLSISDSLKQWKIENLALQIESEKLEELPTPFIAHTKSGGGNFVLVSSVNGTLNYIDEKGKEQNKPKDEFVKDWNGVVLLAEADEQSGQKNHAGERRKEIGENLRIPAIISTCLVLISFYALVQKANNDLWSFILLLIKLFGSIVTGLLLWFEIDKSNPVLKQICSAGKNTNCTAVLGSKESKLFGAVSWSEIGFFYFTGGFLFLLSSVNNHQSSLAIVSWLNLFALPYTIFSIFYQWRIVKQWCPLCLAVQALLVLEFAAGYFGYWNNFSSHPDILSLSQGELLILFTVFLLPVFFWVAAKKAYLGAQNGKQYQRELSRLKYNKEIFNALLEKQKAVAVSSEGLGITLGNPNASYKIIKVCNPYCEPCSKAHMPIKELLEMNPDLQIQIIFMGSSNNSRTPPVSHLLAIAQKNDEILTKQALNDWYTPEKKDYKAFAKKYPLNEEELKMQTAKIDAMTKWCIDTNITFTPTIFVSLPIKQNARLSMFYQLPEVYSVTDLKYFLSV